MTTPNGIAETLPQPTTSRWQPMRLGLVDLFYYDDEQFWFHDGRLLLRGNNGTGKSKVLALTLPFLLDGSTLPRRVEPDADPKKRMEWNLLLGGAHPGTERTGYSWVEFGRRDESGTARFTTLGIGLKAASGRGIVKSWYFISSRRIGDLRLLDETRTVVSQERLKEDLTATGSGQVYTTQASYRRAVDETLFRLGEERYGALIDLLIQLRQPQLSRRPDEKALSAALTEALAPLDQAIIADVAESFRSLEDERAGVAEAGETLQAAEEFLRHYRAYAQVATRRRTTDVRLANSAYDHAGRDLREAEEHLAAAAADLERLAALRIEIEERQGRLQGQEQALRESPEMRDATRLEQAATAAEEAEQLAEQAHAERDRAAAAAQAEQDDAEAAATRQEESAAEAQRLEANAAVQAAAAGLSGEHPDISADPEAAAAVITRRREQVDYIRGFIDSVAQARAQAEHDRRALDTAQSEAADRAEALRSARERLAETVASYRAAVRTYLAGLEVLHLDQDPEELSDLAEEWARTNAGPAPVPGALDEAVAAALGAIADERAQAEQTRRQLEEQVHTVRAEITDLEAGRDPHPPVAPGRDQEARQERPGAPLWWLADFTPDLPSPARAGLEAALQSAGLLDAWIFPDGTLTVDNDVALGAHGPTAAVGLSSVLVPAGADEKVSADVVRAVLDRIGWGADSGANWWVDSQGRWGAGPARGSWTKQRAEYLGAGARQAHRQQLLARLRAQVDQLEQDLAAATHRIEAAKAAAGQLRRERAQYPLALERDLGAEHARAESAERESERAASRAETLHATWEAAATAAVNAAQELAEHGAELGVGTTVAETNAVLAALARYDVALVEARLAARSAVTAAADADKAAHRAAQAAQVLATRTSEHTSRRAHASSLRARFTELHETVGASVAELQARLAQTTTALAELADRLGNLNDDQLRAATKHGRLEENVRDQARRREEARQAREAASAALRSFIDTGLLRVALPEQVVPQEWTLTAALELSRAVDQQLGDTDESEDAWSRAQQRASGASTELSAQMSRHGHQASLEQRQDVLVVRVRYLQEEVDIDLLALRLAQDVADRERLLSAREREILENHLVNEVAGHLHELMVRAEEQIDGMNRELQMRKTSTGMQLRMQWRERSDGPPALTEAKKLLIRSDATWTAQDRAAIGDFLQAQIAQVRQADPTGGWQEHLEQALDYRQWHSFAVQRWQSGQWRSASGPASGGERALAVSVPLFAAASAHYNSADPNAPRLILLDEAFAGVDDDSRAKSLGLLATFDLDVVMTSEREWGCYPQVPGLSIAQLTRVEGIDAVGVSRWRWDGRRRHQVEVATAGPGQLDEPSLFG